MELIENIVNEAYEHTVYKAVFSVPLNSEYKKIEIKQLQNKIQCTKYTQTQVFHSTIEKIDLKQEMLSLIDDYKQTNIFTQDMEFMIKKTKKGKVQVSKKKIEQKQINLTHNRKKNYLLEEGEVIAPLVDMGIFTKEGKVVASMYDKYRQINKFIEILDDEFKKIDRNEINIIDFGCGKSYLTFIVYYYLTEIRKMNVKLVGLDLKKDVIEHCNLAAKKYGYNQLHFEVGNIEGYKADFKVDGVITLHACDTATDYALYHAIKWGADYIFSVPCCQHELNTQIETNNYEILTRYGIVKERICALYTDVIRCNLLQACGYKTQLLEFVDLSHTPKNMLIRSRKTNMPREFKQKMLKEVNQLVNEFHLDPTLLRLLKNDGLIED